MASDDDDDNFDWDSFGPAKSDMKVLGDGPKANREPENAFSMTVDEVYQDAKDKLFPVRRYTVKLPPVKNGLGTTVRVPVTVYAHMYILDDGALHFITTRVMKCFKDTKVAVINEKVRTFAPGRWVEVEEAV